MSTERAASYNERGRGMFPGLLGMEIVEVTPTAVHARLDIRTEHLAPNGFLHAGSVVTLADTACGYGTLESKPDGVASFTTIELKANFLGTARAGAIVCRATRVHGGRTTQVWDATVSDESTGKTIALFRCTQLLLAPR